MTDIQNLQEPNQIAKERPESPNGPAENRHGGHRVLYTVLTVFILTQAAFVGYAHWFLTRGLPEALTDVSHSGLLQDLRALTESPVNGFTPIGPPAKNPPTPPDQQAENNPENLAPNAPFIQPDDGLSVDNLLDIVESLTQDLDEQLRALEDPSYTPRPRGHQGELFPLPERYPSPQGTGHRIGFQLS